MATPVAPPNEFDVARNRAAQQTNAAVQQQRDALKRRAAAIGNVNSGSFIKQDQIAAREGAKQLNDANEGINAAEQVENRRVREMKEQRDFQTAERIGSQQFATGERIGAQGFSTGERLATQKFAGQQAAMDRVLAEAGLTGTYKGKATLAGKTYENAVKQTAFENKENVKTNTAATLGNLKNLGYSEQQIGDILDGLGINLKDIMGVTTAPPPAPKRVPVPVQPAQRFPTYPTYGDGSHTG